jgi:hypothetical protein
MVFRTPWDEALAPEVSPELPETMPAPPKKRGRRPTPKPETDRDGPAGQGGWLYHHLTITGPSDRVAAFADAARGSGIVPWRVDGARIEEDIFNLAASQPKEMRSLTIEGCRILARQFRERVEARAARAGKRLPAGHAVLGYGFFTAGETPHAAIAGIAEAWSDLRFVLQPRPVD